MSIVNKSEENMLNGLMIDELISMVEKAEKAPERVARPVQSVTRSASYPGLSPRMYNFAIFDQAVIGVA